MTQIKFVYFDVGGVLLLDYSGTNKWNEMVSDLGIDQANKTNFDAVWSKYEKRICLDCDIDTFTEEIAKSAGLSFPPEYSMLMDFVNRFELNPSIWPVAQTAQKKYGVGLLTNMYPRMLSKILERKLIPDIEWDVVVDSSVVNMQKPQPEIYERAEILAGVKPGEILFIDNTQVNLDAAQQRGWQIFFYDTAHPEKSSQQLHELLI